MDLLLSILWILFKIVLGFYILMIVAFGGGAIAEKMKSSNGFLMIVFEVVFVCAALSPLLLIFW